MDGRLDPRTRTIAILRTCGRIGSAYEWGGQAAFWGPLTSVSPEEADPLTRDDADHPAWTALDRAVIEAVDELERDGTLSEPTWLALREDLDDEQVVELLVVHGWYRMIAATCNALDLGVEAWMRPWPTTEAEPGR